MTVRFARFGSASRTGTADPYRDLSVIDERAPRFNQATVGILAVVAMATARSGLYALLALQLSLGLAFGRRWCLPCVFYFEVVEPRLGEGPLEDSRPVRFANQIGTGFLWLATAASALDAHGLGDALGLRGGSARSLGRDHRAVHRLLALPNRRGAPRRSLDRLPAASLISRL